MMTCLFPSPSPSCAILLFYFGTKPANKIRLVKNLFHLNIFKIIPKGLLFSRFFRQFRHFLETSGNCQKLVAIVKNLWQLSEASENCLKLSKFVVNSEITQWLSPQTIQRYRRNSFENSDRSWRWILLIQISA